MKRATIYAYDSEYADGGFRAASTLAEARAAAKGEAEGGSDSRVYRVRAAASDLRRLLVGVYNREGFAESREEVGRWVRLHRTIDSDDPYAVATYAVRWEPVETQPEEGDRG